MGGVGAADECVYIDFGGEGLGVTGGDFSCRRFNKDPGDACPADGVAHQRGGDGIPGGQIPTQDYVASGAVVCKHIAPAVFASVVFAGVVFKRFGGHNFGATGRKRNDAAFGQCQIGHTGGDRVIALCAQRRLCLGTALFGSRALRRGDAEDGGQAGGAFGGEAETADAHHQRSSCSGVGGQRFGFDRRDAVARFGHQDHVKGIEAAFKPVVAQVNKTEAFGQGAVAAQQFVKPE